MEQGEALLAPGGGVHCPHNDRIVFYFFENNVKKRKKSPSRASFYAFTGTDPGLLRFLFCNKPKIFD